MIHWKPESTGMSKPKAVSPALAGGYSAGQRRSPSLSRTRKGTITVSQDTLHVKFHFTRQFNHRAGKTGLPGVSGRVFLERSAFSRLSEGWRPTTSPLPPAHPSFPAGRRSFWFLGLLEQHVLLAPNLYSKSLQISSEVVSQFRIKGSAVL